MKIENLVSSIVSLDLLRRLIELLTGYAVNTSDDITSILTSSERRKKLLRVIWIICVVVALVLTAFFLVAFYLLGTPKVGIIIVTLFWAALLGGAAVLFLSPKIVTAVFGGLVGVSVSDAVSPAGAVAKANAAISVLATQVGVISGTLTPETAQFINLMIWQFIIVFGVFCLPAFFTD